MPVRKEVLLRSRLRAHKSGKAWLDPRVRSASRSNESQTRSVSNTHAGYEGSVSTHPRLPHFHLRCQFAAQRDASAPRHSQGTHSSPGCIHYIDMFMSPLRRAFRCVALALAALQLAVSAGAPVYEAFAARIGGPVPSVASPDFTRGATAHDPETCPACQTLNTFARVPDAVRVLPASGRVGVPGDPAAYSAPTPSARQGFLSRAPPVLLG